MISLAEPQRRQAEAAPTGTFSTRPGRDAVNSGFERELTQLYERQFPSLYRYLDRTLGDSQLATDIAQEAFIRLFDRGAMPDEPVAWLITVVNNLVRDDYRRTGRRLRLLERAGYNVGHSSATPDASAAVDQQERRAQVRAALEHLTPRDRQALLLRHSGYSYREVGLALGITETSVGTILLRAGALFREVYEELHGKPD
jgi:RNA polymerase sigma factor (sigma-70 family)